MFAYDDGINWIWYLDYTPNSDGTVTINRHWREHKGEGNHPKTDVWFRCREDAKRIVRAVTLSGNTFEVKNPQYIFSYK